MNRLHEIGAAAGLGLAAYGLMHVLPTSPAEEVQQHNEAVMVCAEQLDFVARNVDVVPDGCTGFANKFDTYFWGSPMLDDGQDAGRYYLTPRDQFVVENTDGPDELADLEDTYETDALVMGVCAAGIAWVVLRGRSMIKEDRAKMGVSKSPKPKQPKPQRYAQLNEDSPEWMEWAWGRRGV